MRQVLVVAMVAEVFFLAVAVTCLVWPERIREFAVLHGGSGSFYNPFKSWVRTRWYLWQLRIIGVLSIGVAAVIARSMVRCLFSK
jgi:hypothetical protein